MFDHFFQRFVVAIVILLIGLIIGRTVGELLQRVLHEVELDKVVRKAGISVSLESFLSSFATYFIYFITVIWALNEIGLTTTILNMISGAALVLIIISILLAIKDFLPNIIAGFHIYSKSLVRVGDKIKVEKLQGVVSKISLTETEIRTKKGDLIYIPNSSLIKKEFSVKRKS